MLDTQTGGSSFRSDSRYGSCDIFILKIRNGNFYKLIRMKSALNTQQKDALAKARV